MNSSNYFKVTLERPKSKLIAVSDEESTASKRSIGLTVFFTQAVNLQNKN
jgi:hypothetical protein